MGKEDQRGGRLDEVRSFIAELNGHDLHSKRIDALAGATLGVMAAASLAVAIIGQSLAQARRLVPTIVKQRVVIQAVDASHPLCDHDHADEGGVGCPYGACPFYQERGADARPRSNCSPCSGRDGDPRDRQGGGLHHGDGLEMACALCARAAGGSS